MISAAQFSGCLLLVAIAAGTLSDKQSVKHPIVIGGYQVLAADFHVHTFPLSASTLAPWDVALEADRQGLDALAITPHNEALTGRAGQWFSRMIGGPTVLNGEEIHSGGYHIIAVGIRDTISWRLSAAAAIAEVHRQGGVAIAAHPAAYTWPAYNAEAMHSLDGAEVLQPISYVDEVAATQLHEFYARRPMAAIGSSDFHGPGPVGLCRTYVFARENTESGILEALRARRTLVFDRGHVYGDPATIRMAQEAHFTEPVRPPEGWLTILSRCCGVAGLLGLVFFKK